MTVRGVADEVVPADVGAPEDDAVGLDVGVTGCVVGTAGRVVAVVGDALVGGGGVGAGVDDAPVDDATVGDVTGRVAVVDDAATGKVGCAVAGAGAGASVTGGCASGCDGWSFASTGAGCWMTGTGQARGRIRGMFATYLGCGALSMTLVPPRMLVPLGLLVPSGL